MKKYILLIALTTFTILLSSCTFEFATVEPVDPYQEQTKDNSKKDDEKKQEEEDLVTPETTEYKIYFYDEDIKLGEDTIKAGSSLAFVEYEMKDNLECKYTFRGWDANDDGIVEEFPYQINSETTFKAIYDIEYIIYHYDIYVKGVKVRDVDCHYGDPIDYPKVDNEIIDDEVYFFEGWQFNDKPLDGMIYLNCCENYTITAVYADSQIAKFYYNDNLYANIIPKDTTLTYLVDWNVEVPDGYNIAWYTDSEYKNPSTITVMPEGNLTLYGVLEKSERGTLVNSQEELLAYFKNMMINRVTTKTFDVNFEYESINAILSYLTSNTPVLYNYGVNALAERKMLTITLSFGEMATTKSEHILYTQVNSYDYHENVKTRENNAILPVDLRNSTYNVTHSDALFYALEHGYKPVIDEENTNLLSLYNKMRNVLENIINDTDTDYEKVTKIYEYLVMNVTYDKEVLTLIENNSDDLEKYNCFYLEGVFNDKLAVCDGISKAFASLCQMEGIDAIRVTGKVNESQINHAWNKVCINNIWYVVDVTSGGTIIGSEEVLTYSYLLISDEKYSSYATEAQGEWDITCTGEYNYYENVLRDFTNQTDLENYLKDFFKDIDESSSNGKYSTNFKVSFSYESIDSLINSIFTNLKLSKEISYSEPLGSITIIYEKK